MQKHIIFPGQKDGINHIDFNYNQDHIYTPVAVNQININVTNNVNQIPLFNDLIEDSNYNPFFYTKPQMSPMDLKQIVFHPQSTRNIFNMDISDMYEPNLKNQNSLLTKQTPKINYCNYSFTSNNNTNNFGFSAIPESPTYHDYTYIITPSNNMSLKNKIIFDAPDNMNTNKNIFENKEDNTNNNAVNITNNNISNNNNTNNLANNANNTNNENSIEPKRFIKSQRPQIDLALVDQSETNNIFMQSCLSSNRDSSMNINYTNLFDLSPHSAFSHQKY